MKKLLTLAAVAAGLALAPANATTLVFKGDGNNVTPLGTAGVDFIENCASTGDFCSNDPAEGLDYTEGNIELTVIAYSDGDPTRLIQDINPSDSGLGAWSENDNSADQTQFDADEAIEFIFGEMVTVFDVEFNAGGDTDCTNTSDGSGEGSCGEFRLDIYDLANILIFSDVIDITNTNVLPLLGTGARFLLTALTPGSGFSIAQLSASPIPVPGALPLLLSGIAGLGFASRKKKKAA